jgi:hypothetical protein
MFAAADPQRTLLALDCDLLVGEQLADSKRDCVAAVPAGFTLPERAWVLLYRELGLPLLPEPLVSTISHERIPVPYVNSGVIVMPGRWAGELADAWLYYARVLKDLPIWGKWSGRRDFYREQVALSCALTALQLPLRLLPVQYNAPFRLAHLRRVRALHYHNHVGSDGSVNMPPAAAARALVTHVNKAMRDAGLTHAD